MSLYRSPIWWLLLCHFAAIALSFFHSLTRLLYACLKPSNRTEWILLKTKENFFFHSLTTIFCAVPLRCCDEGKVFIFFCYIRCGVMLAINMTQCTINICLFISNFLTPPADFLPELLCCLFCVCITFTHYNTYIL